MTAPELPICEGRYYQRVGLPVGPSLRCGRAANGEWGGQWLCRYHLAKRKAKQRQRDQRPAPAPDVRKPEPGERE